MVEPKEEKPSDYINRFLQQRRKIFLRIPEWDKRLVIEFFLEGEHLQSQIKKISSSNSSVPSALDEATVTNKFISDTPTNLTLPNLTEPHPTASCPFPYSEAHSHTISDISSFIGKYFNSFDRINILCDRLNISFNDRKGRTIPEKISYLVSYCKDKDSLVELSKIAEEESLSVDGSVSIDDTRDNLDGQHGEQISSKVFISYSWDSEEHKNRVLGFANTLRTKWGIETYIDMYVRGEYPYTPLKGWDRWMEDKIEESDFVLIVCTEKYYRRFRGDEKSGQGLGVTWEGKIISQELYSGQLKNTKFIPVVFSPDDFDHIPRILKANDPYTLNTEESMVYLCRRLKGIPSIVIPEVEKVELPAPPEPMFF